MHYQKDYTLIYHEEQGIPFYTIQFENHITSKKEEVRIKNEAAPFWEEMIRHEESRARKDRRYLHKFPFSDEEMEVRLTKQHGQDFRKETIQKELLKEIRQYVSDKDWDLFENMAGGMTRDKIAELYHITKKELRDRLCYARKKVPKSLIDGYQHYIF